MMVNECSTERMTWSSAMRRQAILEYSSVHQPLNYLLCLKFRAMIKFQRFVWQHCYPIPSSNEAFILKIERETGIKWQETMPAQAKILKMNIFNKDNIRFVCWMLRVGCHFNTCVLYLHKTAHAFYTRWQPYTIRSNNKIRSPTKKTDRNGNSKGWIRRRGKKRREWANEMWTKLRNGKPNNKRWWRCAFYRWISNRCHCWWYVARPVFLSTLLLLLENFRIIYRFPRHHSTLK